MTEDEWGTPTLAYPLTKGFERIGEGAVPELLQASYDGSEFRVTLSIRVYDGRAHLVSMQLHAIEPHDEIARASFGGIPLRRLVDRAIAKAHHVIEPGRLRPSPREIPQRKEMTQAFKRQIADVYNAAMKANVNGTEAVQRALGANSYRTAARWVRLARESGLIGEGKR